MASVVAGGLFNAVAFAGAEKEMKRHNKAMEKLAQAKEKWYEDKATKQEKLRKMRQELNDARDEFDEVNDALDNYRVAHEDFVVHEELKPTIKDFYKPSDEMKGYENIVLGTIGLGGGWLLTKWVR